MARSGAARVLVERAHPATAASGFVRAARGGATGVGRHGRVRPAPAAGGATGRHSEADAVPAGAAAVKRVTARKKLWKFDAISDGCLRVGFEFDAINVVQRCCTRW